MFSRFSLVVAVGLREWWVVAVAGISLVGNGLGWWNQLRLRRRGPDRGAHTADGH